MAKKRKRRPARMPEARQQPPRRPPRVRMPVQKRSSGNRRVLLYGGLAALALIGAVVAIVAVRGGGGGTPSGGETAARGLPDTPDYHSLLVAPNDPKRLVLGTHNGLYVSADGGRTWTFDALPGNDAMNLARPDPRTVWLAGHNVFKKSTDGGASWTDVLPAGLPSLDLHGFAADPRDPNSLFAAVAGRGLYHSSDGGRTFSLVSQDVGGNVMALAVLPDGRLLAGDMQQGLLETRDGGKTWRRSLQAPIVGLAVNPRHPRRIVASGEGIALSTNGGRSWKSVLDLPEGAGPLAWSPSNPRLAYAVGFDRTLYRSDNSGESWTPVE